MIYLAYVVFLILNLNQPQPILNETIEESVNQFTKELANKYSSNFKVSVAILEFRTSSNKVSRLNQLIQKELHQSIAAYNNFKVIEQYSVNHILEEQGWSLENANSFKSYSAINEKLFKNTGTIADVFLYGIISLDEENVFITGCIVPGGVISNGSKKTFKIPVNNLPSDYLEKD
ncbi:MAG TPA: hypothetical protein PK784_12055 [Tenuifilaceae bacterium]|nr:hypothetical protein [Tenuifilaceae bacterium]HPN23230.1 hypothetical protein [Tenuifilaceae bacterium]